jgi:hypothetical protein
MNVCDGMPRVFESASSVVIVDRACSSGMVGVLSMLFVFFKVSWESGCERGEGLDLRLCVE